MMNLPQARMATHPDDPDARIDHATWGGHMVHTHVIKEAWSERDKNALAAHIDRYHAPVYTHGEPGAYDCNWPDCTLDGHKRAL